MEYRLWIKESSRELVCWRGIDFPPARLPAFDVRSQWVGEPESLTGTSASLQYNAGQL
jgi:hypothetical protein